MIARLVLALAFVAPAAALSVASLSAARPTLRSARTPPARALLVESAAAVTATSAVTELLPFATTTLLAIDFSGTFGKTFLAGVAIACATLVRRRRCLDVPREK